MGGILNSIAKFSQSSYLAEQHALFANNYSKFYRAIDMELSIDRGNRPPMLEYVKKMRDNYDKLLDDAPQIPAVSIAAFNERFKEEKGMPYKTRQRDKIKQGKSKFTLFKASFLVRDSSSTDGLLIHCSPCSGTVVEEDSIQQPMYHLMRERRQDNGNNKTL